MPQDYSSNSGGGDPYDDGPAAAPQAEPEGQEKSDEGGPTGVLPKSILMGKDFNTGDELVLKILAIHDDEIEVGYAPEKGKGEGKEEMAESPAPSGGGGEGQMSSYME